MIQIDLDADLNMVDDVDRNLARPPTNSAGLKVGGRRCCRSTGILVLGRDRGDHRLVRLLPPGDCSRGDCTRRSADPLLVTLGSVLTEDDVRELRLADQR